MASPPALVFSIVMFTQRVEFGRVGAASRSDYSMYDAGGTLLSGHDILQNLGNPKFCEAWLEDHTRAVDVDKGVSLEALFAEPVMVRMVKVAHSVGRGVR